MFISRLSAVSRTLFGYSGASGALHETDWLNGVRGVAAFCVLLNHVNLEWASLYFEAPWGSTVTGTFNPDGVYYHQDGDRLWAPWRLPILRVIAIAGGAQVAVFFVLSGMVLSWSSLKAARAGNVDKLYGSLSSSMIRRWMRLFLPCIIVGLFYCIHKMYWDYHGIGGIFNELLHYAHVVEQWSNPFTTAYMMQMATNNEYSFVMWTIPFEYGGSLFTYVSVLGLSRMPNVLYRIVIILLIALYACGKKLWGFWLFGFGIALTDYVQANGGFKKLAESTSRATNILWWGIFILGLLIMGWTGPNEKYTTPGYEWTQLLWVPDGYRGFVGEDRYWHGWGGILLLLGASHLRPVHRFYELSFVQYLGRISFMLYLIHFFINNTVSLPIRHRVYSWLCTKEYDELYKGDVFRTSALFNVGTHLFLLTVSVALTFMISNQLEIWVDKPCTNLGKWVDGKLSGRASRQEEKVEEEHQLLPTHNAGNANED